MQAAQEIKSRISRRTILSIVVVLYILLSAVYIVFTQFQAFQARLIQDAYLSGRVATIEELLDEAEDSCQPFPIYVDDRQVELINVACLVPPEEAEANDPAPVAPSSE